MIEQNGTSPGQSLAARFKQQQTAIRKEVDLPIPGIPGTPDFKFRCILRRVDILTLIKGAQLPDRLKHSLLGLKPAETVANIKEEAKKAAQEKVREMTMADIEQINVFQRQVAQKTCIAPKIVFEDTDDPEAINLNPEVCEIGPQIVEALYAYGMNLSPDVPIALVDGGETTVKAVETFPDSAPGRELPGTGHDGAEFPSVTGGLPRNR